MKNAIGLAVSVFVALFVVVACGKKDDTKNKPAVPVRGAPAPNGKTTPTPSGRTNPAPVDPQTGQPAAPGTTTSPAVEEPVSIDDSKLNEQPMSANASCALPRELELSQNETGEIGKLADNETGSWELEKTEVWVEIENTDTKAKGQMLAAGEQTPENAPVNQAIQERVRVLCHTAKDAVSTGITGMPFLRVTIDFPKSIERKTGKSEAVRVDTFIANKEKVRAAMTVNARAVNVREAGQIAQFTGDIAQTVSIGADKKTAAIQIRTVELVGRNHKWTTVRKATYKAIGQ